MAFPDRGYTNLLSHLTQPHPTLPLPTIQASIAHYLAHQSPTPTPFAATVLNSPLFRPLSLTKLDLLTTAFRYSPHLKLQLLQDEGEPGLFSYGLRTQLTQWISAVVKGAQGGQATVRLACLGGLLLGVGDLNAKIDLGKTGVVGKIENEVLVALAEVMDAFKRLENPDGWEREFHPATEAGEVDALSLTFVLASQSLQLVPDAKLSALPLLTFSRLLCSTIDTTFHSGQFLNGLSSSSVPNEGYKVFIAPDSAFAMELRAMSTSPLFSQIGPLSKMLARTLSLLLDSRPQEGMQAVSECLQALDALTARVETDWAASALSGVINEEDIEPSTREVTKSIWTTLKTLLFTTIMITDVSLSTVVFVPPPHSSSSSSVLALTTLHAMAHLSFVITQFGGVTTTSSGGFTELKKAFYVALDILSGDAEASARFVRRECESFQNADGTDHPLQQAKKAYVLASIEQLVPVLGVECIQTHVFPLCLPHLSDHTHRETYESAHSVVLSIFSYHAQHLPDGEYARFTERLVPFYANCLIENSSDGKLTTPQLRLAYAALVRGALPSNTSQDKEEGLTLAQYCVNTLTDAIHHLAPAETERRHRLHLTLVSTVSAVPMVLLSGVLDELKEIIVGDGDDGERRREVAEALFEEMVERVGDREKQFVMRWWYAWRPVLGGEMGVETPTPMARL